jgi:hypothetical protein
VAVAVGLLPGVVLDAACVVDADVEFVVSIRLAVAHRLHELRKKRVSGGEEEEEAKEERWTGG